MHQTQRELFDVHGPLESLEGLQVTLDAWRMEYNTHRPHQSLPMAFADSRFPRRCRRWSCASRHSSRRAPTSGATEASPDPLSAQSLPVEATPEPVTETPDRQPAVEVDRVVPPSGNLWIGCQQV
jgi:hypothetical protein